jgi:dihydrofolate reductase
VGQVRPQLEFRQGRPPRLRETRRPIALIYSAICSLDGYVADRNGNFDWAAPGEEVHAFVNELERPIGTHLYGRRMYETMSVWETMPVDGEPSVMRDFQQIWRAADKVVYSTTLDAVSTTRTTLEREFDPDTVRTLVGSAAGVSVGGPTLAAHAFAAGLVDECHLFLVPVIVGGGPRALPDGVRLTLHLAGEHRFASGVVYLHYRAGG